MISWCNWLFLNSREKEKGGESHAAETAAAGPEGPCAAEAEDAQHVPQAKQLPLARVSG